MGLGKFPHPSLYMGIPVVSYCCHRDGSGEFIPDGDLPIANTILDDLVAYDSVEARKEIVRCSGEKVVRGTVLTPQGSRRATLVERDVKGDKWSGRVKC